MQRILRALQSSGVNTVTINKDESEFSGSISPALLEALEDRYPHSVEIGHFAVRWAH